MKNYPTATYLKTTGLIGKEIDERRMNSSCFNKIKRSDSTLRQSSIVIRHSIWILDKNDSFA
jgi:hypothetical protein